MIWTDEHVSTLRDLVADGKTITEIAGVFGIGRGAVSGKMKRLHLRSMNPQHRHARKKEKPAAEKVACPRKRRHLIVLHTKPKPRPEPRPEPLPAQPAQPIYAGKPQTIIEVLTSGGCKFAVTPHDAPEHLFCGGPRANGPYCPAHAQLCYNAPYNRDLSRFAGFVQ